LQKLLFSGKILHIEMEVYLLMKIILNNTLKLKNKSQYWLSKQTGIAASTINNLCNGKTDSISFSVLDKICEAIDCEISDILMHEKGDIPQ